MRTVIIAMRTLLAADTELMVLLGNPTAEPHQIFYPQPPEKPTIPQVVVSPAAGNADGESELDIGATVLRVTSWATEDTFDQIAERIVHLLHQKAVGTDANLVHTATPIPCTYDDDLACYGRVDEFIVHRRRTA
jgi:hypothetical protein